MVNRLSRGHVVVGKISAAGDVDIFDDLSITDTLTVGGATSLAALTATGLVTTAASATGSAGLNVPEGTAPTSPVNGDIWATSAGLYVRINGGTVGPLS